MCSSGLRFGGLCYEVKTDPRSYQGAADVCAANGGLLAAIKNKSIQDFIAVSMRFFKTFLVLAKHPLLKQFFLFELNAKLDMCVLM